MGSHKKDMEQFVRDLEAEGCVVTLGRKSGHYRVIYKDKGPVFMPATPSDHRWLKNSLSEIRRAGFPVPSRYGRPSAKPRKARPTPKPAPPPPTPAPAPKPEPIKEKEPVMVEEQESGGKFERYVPDNVRGDQSRANVYITKSAQLYISATAYQRLGDPERLEISVNKESAEMMIWNDDKGALKVSPRKNGSHSAACGATGLVRHFDLPTQSRWYVIDSAPGRILVKWEE